MSVLRLMVLQAQSNHGLNKPPAPQRVLIPSGCMHLALGAPRISPYTAHAAPGPSKTKKREKRESWHAGSTSQPLSPFFPSFLPFSDGGERRFRRSKASNEKLKVQGCSLPQGDAIWAADLMRNRLKSLELRTLDLAGLWNWKRRSELKFVWML